MTAKKKLIISFTALLLIILALAISLILVLSASRVVVNTGVNVTYTAREVAGTISASYKVTTGEETAIGSTITLDGSEEDDDAKSLGNATVTLTKTDNYVVYKYVFTCEEGANDYTATLTYTDADNDDVNIKIEYSTNGTSYSTTNATPITVTDSASSTIYIKVSVVNLAKDAVFTGNFAWALATVVTGD